MTTALPRQARRLKKSLAEADERKRQAAYAACSVLALGALVALAHLLGVEVCPVKRLIGLPCPTCGSTRAVFLAARGDFAGAFAMQPLVSSLLLVGLPASLLCVLFVGRRRFLKALLFVARSWIFWTAAALAVAGNWAYAILNGN